MQPFAWAGCLPQEEGFLWESYVVCSSSNDSIFAISPTFLADCPVDLWVLEEFSEEGDPKINVFSEYVVQDKRLHRGW